MKIGYNPSIMTAYNSLTSTDKSIEKTARALSTGLRSAFACDDAAGFAIGLRLSSQITGVERAIRNTQDGVSMLQTAEGGLNQINSMLQRMRELSIQAANDTLTTQDRDYIQLEINELKDNIDNISHNTTFNSKRLLDGSSSCTWTSQEDKTKVYVAGAITSLDEFGQKKSVEGNYRIEVRTQAGQAEVKKSNIFNVTVAEDVTKVFSSSEVVTETVNTSQTLTYSIFLNEGNDTVLATSGDGWEFNDGVLNITDSGVFNIVGNGRPSANKIVVQEGVSAEIFLTNVNINSSESAFDMKGADVNLYLRGANLLQSGEGHAGIELDESSSLTINSAIESGSNQGFLEAIGGTNGAGIGSGSQTDAGDIIINGGTINARGGNQAAGIGGGAAGAASSIEINAGDVTAVAGSQGAGIGTGHYSFNRTDLTTEITISGGKVAAYGGNGGGMFDGAGIGGACHSSSVNVTIQESLRNEIIAVKGGNSAQDIGRGAEPGASIFSVEYEEIPEESPDDIPALETINVEAGTTIMRLANENDTVTDYRVRPARLSEINLLKRADGSSLLEFPQQITITQGDGRKANVTLYSEDTMYEVAEKINHAISETLGQGMYVDNSNKFCTIADGTPFTSESVNENIPVYNEAGVLRTHTQTATMVVRSAIAGSSGRLTFSSSNQDLINALGFNTIQEATENTYSASIFEAHSGEIIAENLVTNMNKLNGVIHENLSIEFDSMANITTTWNEQTKSYVMSSNSNPYETSVHIVDRSTSFQIGQNEGEDIYINIGDMSSSALGLEGLNVLTRENASEAIGILDAAIHKVSMQRDKIGSYQNELEYNANSLTVTHLNMSESESRIKDTDMAKEMVEYLKLQILNNAGNSMLAQANQFSQSVMSLINV